MYKVSFLFTPACDEQPEQAIYIVQAGTADDATVMALQSFHEVQPKGDAVHKTTIRCTNLGNNNCVRLQ